MNPEEVAADLRKRRASDTMDRFEAAYWMFRRWEFLYRRAQADAGIERKYIDKYVKEWYLKLLNSGAIHKDKHYDML